MSDNPPSTGSKPSTGLTGASLPAAVMAVAVVVALSATSTYALVTVALDGLAAATLLLPAVLGGLCVVPLFRLGKLPLRWHLLLGAAVGIGLLSTLVLVLGSCGVMSRGIWIVVLVGAFGAGIMRLRRLLAEGTNEGDAGPDSAFRWLWLVLTPFLILALLAAAHAPGYLWSEEGGGYDALEYHLELPKEYRAAGHVGYTPHNVYGNFPANVEMHYLLAMIILDTDVEAGTVAHQIHLTLGILTVFAAYVVGREWSRRAGTIAAVVLGSCGWLVYLSGLAYVENGMLFFGMTAIGAALRALGTCGGDRQAEGGVRPWRWYVVAGVAAGFACGCKYTGIPMFAVPVAVSALLVPRAPWSRLRCVAACVVASVAAMSPWLIKNTITTGNPVFPLANSVMKATPPGWGMAESDHWDRCHSAAVETQGGSHGPHGRLDLFGSHILYDRYGRFGPLLFLAGIAGLLVARPGRREAALVAMLAVQLGVWMFATHLYARFAVVILVPLSLLGGRCALATGSARKTAAVVALLIAGAGLNFLAVLALYRREAVPGAVAPASYLYEGLVGGYEHFGTINRDLPDDARVLLVGDARGFYYQRDIDYWVVFNHSAFVDAVRESSAPEDVTAWLRSHRFTHVLVHYAEIDRLRRSAYGFPPSITRDLFSALERSGGLKRIAAFGGNATSPRVAVYRVETP